MLAHSLADSDNIILFDMFILSDSQCAAKATSSQAVVCCLSQVLFFIVCTMFAAVSGSAGERESNEGCHGASCC